MAEGIIRGLALYEDLRYLDLEFHYTQKKSFENPTIPWYQLEEVGFTLRLTLTT